jgi:hypothetical protein
VRGIPKKLPVKSGVSKPVEYCAAACVADPNTTNAAKKEGIRKRMDYRSFANNVNDNEMSSLV